MHLFTLLLYMKKIMENNIVFQTTHHNFCILQFTRYVGLHLSESLISCALSDVRHLFLTNGKERREPCTAN